MIKGFNSDIQVGSESFHVQTEDWGKEKGCIVTRVFRNGAVESSIKTSYSEVFNYNPNNPMPALRLAMQIQHEKILDKLLGVLEN